MTGHRTYTGGSQRSITPDRLVSMRTEERTDAMVVHVAGEVDLGTVAPLWDCLTAQLASSARFPVLVVDLAAVDSMTIAGLHILLDAQRHAAAHGIALRLAGCSPVVLRLLELSGCHAQFRTYRTVASAAEGLDGGADPVA